MAINILNVNDIQSLADKTSIQGLVLIKDYSKLPTKTPGKYYLGGVLEAQGSLSFKVWQGTCYNVLLESDFRNKICFIEGSVNEWQGTRSLVIQEVSEVSPEYLAENDIKPTDFVSCKYSVDKYFSLLTNVLQSNLSEEAMSIFTTLINDDSITEQKFKYEFGSLHHHDNCNGGLLAHTTKVVRLASIISMYPNITSKVNKDLLYLGCAIHDIGKVYEYNNGLISSQGKYISHLTSGILLLDKYREDIVMLMGEDFFYSLMSIVSQHHGEYGEKPRTIAAYVIHILDLLDTNLTTLDLSCESIEKGEQVKFDGLTLI